MVARRPPGSPLLQRPGAGGLGPLPPPPSHPGAPPPHTLHLQGNLVLRAGALNFLGGGRREGQPLGNPLPGALLKMVQTLPGRPRPTPPPAHQNLSPNLGCGPVGTQAPKASSWIRSYHLLAPSPPTYSPWLGHLQIGTPPPFPPPAVGNSPLALVECIHPSVHPSIRPSTLVPT